MRGCYARKPQALRHIRDSLLSPLSDVEPVSVHTGNGVSLFGRFARWALLGAALVLNAAGRPVRVGVFTHVPAIYMDPVDGQPKGFYVDMLREVAARENWDLHFVPGSWSQGLERVRSGELDLITSAARTPERETFLSFGRESSFTVWSLLYANPKVPITGIMDVAGKRVGIMAGDANGANFRSLCASFRIDCEFVPMDSFEDVLGAVAAGRVDAGVTPSTFGYAREAGFKVVRTPVLVSPFDIYFATAKDRNLDLLQALDRYLKAGKANRNSGYEAALERWMFSRSGHTETPSWVPRALLASGALLAFAFGAVMVFRRRVQAATREIVALNRGLEHELAERRRKEETILNVASGVSSSIGETFFQDLVTYLGRAAEADIAYVSEAFERDGTTWLRTLAVAGQGGTAPFEYPLEGTPCERVVRDGVCTFSSGVADRFPRSGLLREMGAQGYVGAPLEDAEGHLGGVLAVVTRRPLEDPGEAASLLRIFSTRASAELQRRRVEGERLAMERQILHSQKLESLGVLAGGIAHDFNNLLTAVMGHLNLAQVKLDPGSPSAPHLAAIEQIVGRASDLTRQMLAYSGKGRFVVKNHDVNQVIREMAHLLEVSITKKATLALELAEQLPPIEADAAQIQQVVLNLVTNASDAIGEAGGSIRIRTSVRDLAAPDLEGVHQGSAMAPGPHVCLEVEDTGCGMEPAILARIFDPFFTTKETGHGLGLSAIQGILRGHRAGLTIRSETGRGTTFHVFFPVAEGSAAPSAAPSEAQSGPLRGTVLLVDDEEIITMAIAAMLETLGLQVLVAHDGVEALETFRRDPGRVDLVLMDLTMPRMDGRETFDVLHAEAPDLPVILSSGYDERESVLEFTGKGLAGFLQKPYTIRALAQAIGPALRRADPRP